MSNISPNSLFHFTPKLDYLINIFKNGFQPRYFHEELYLNESKAFRGHSTGIPMICFCDISLSQISSHIKFYGSYGIGMKKEWAIKNGLNPVIYINKDSQVADQMSNLIESCVNLIQLKNSNAQDIANTLIVNCLNLQKNFKPYTGNFIHSGINHPNKKFYDEREWRYIPDVQSILSQEVMLDKPLLAEKNKDIEKYSLQFTPDDVKYIFIKDESQIHSVVNKLRKIAKQKNYDPKTVDILTSKILTIKNVKEDL